MMLPGQSNQRPACARDSDWCDGIICRDNGIDCPNAEPVDVVSPAIYREGWDSFHAQGHRRTISANPYAYGGPRWSAWREGYTDAESERMKAP